MKEKVFLNELFFNFRQILEDIRYGGLKESLVNIEMSDISEITSKKMMRHFWQI